jgi:transcriptional regulator with XRE-family HTH domain
MPESTKIPAPDIGGNIRRAREAVGISLRAMARHIGVKPQVWCDTELGRRRPKADEVWRAAHRLGVPVGMLFMAVDSAARKAA